MSQPLVANDILGVVVEGMNGQQPWAFERFYQVESVSDTDALLADLASLFESGSLSSMAALLASTWTAECLSVHRVAPKPRNVFFHPFATAFVGAISTDCTPNDNALLLRFESDEVGPSNRGRMYVPGLPEAATTGGLLNAADQAGWDTAAANFKTAVNTGHGVCNAVLFSRTIYNVNKAAPYTDYTSPITGCFVVGNLASQRRRRRARNTFSPEP